MTTPVLDAPLPNTLPPRTLTPFGAKTFPRAALTNLARRDCRCWVEFALPKKNVLASAQETTFLTDRGLQLRASRCEDVGEHSTMWRVFAPLGALQTISGTLVEPTGEVQVQGFKTHPWIGDKPQALVPGIGLRIAQKDGPPKDFFTTGFTTLELVDCLPGVGAMQRFHFVGPVGTSGWLIDGFLSIFHGSPVADLEFDLVWSDRNSPEPRARVEGVMFSAGEFVRFDFYEQYGVRFEPAYAGDKWVHAAVGGPTWVLDGGTIPFVGRMLCLPQVDPMSYVTDQWAEDLNTLFASYDGSAVGLAEGPEWAGKWLAHRNLPRMLPAALTILRESADATLAVFGAAQVPLGLYARRPIGCTGKPSQAGDQEDFAATKGTIPLLLGDARWLPFAMHSVLADKFRGVSHYEDNKPLDPKKHPKWYTWTRGTHWPLAEDKLGKRPPTFGELDVVPWEKHDDQHLSQNNLHALYALTGRPILRSLIQHQSVVDYAAARFRLDYGSDAARAVGRRAQHYANSILLTKPGSVERARYVELAEDLYRQFRRDWQGDKWNGGVDVHDVFADDRLGVTFGGKSVKAWVCWQNAVLVLGAYALWKATGHAGWREVAQRVGRAIARHGIFQETDGRWWVAAAVAWVDPELAAQIDPNLVEGAPLPAKWYSSNPAVSTLVAPTREGVAEWVVPALMSYVELADPAEVATVGRAREALESLGAGTEAKDSRSAEWWAAARSVPPEHGAAAQYE